MRAVPLKPLPKVIEEDAGTAGLSVMVIEAGRDAKGVLWGRVQAWTGTLAQEHVFPVCDMKKRRDFARAVADQVAGAEWAKLDAALLRASAGLSIAADCADGADGDEPRISQANILAEIAARADLFHDPAGELYATVERGGHRETWLIRSQAFRRWLTGVFYAESGKAPSAQAVADALNVAQARAQFDGPEHPVAVRVAPDGDGGFYVDLGDADWRAVHVTPTGWQVLASPPVRFRRSPGTRLLPEPAVGGKLDDLRDHLNAPGDAWPLVKGWLVAALRDKGPYPVLAIQGEQGSGKTITARMIRRFVDPAVPELRSDPREIRDLAVAARSTWVVGFDNVSRIPDWLSDALCRLATGGGWATRELYTDADEMLFEACRPVLLNGITEFIERDDLRDRAVSLVLPTIEEAKRKQERDLWAAFEEAAPRLFGALLTYAAGALRELPDVKLATLPRMADFAAWAVAAERGARAPGANTPDDAPGSFLAAYAASRQSGHQQALDASIVGPVLVRFLGSAVGGKWSGTAAELRDVLTPVAGDTAKARDWPKTPRGISGELRRLAPALRGAGYKAELPKPEGHDRRRVWSLTTPEATENEKGKNGPAPPQEEAPVQPSAPSAPSAGSSGEPKDADGRGVGGPVQPSATGAQPSATVRTSAGSERGAVRADGADGPNPHFSGEPTDTDIVALAQRHGWPAGAIGAWGRIGDERRWRHAATMATAAERLELWAWLGARGDPPGEDEPVPLAFVGGGKIDAERLTALIRAGVPEPDPRERSRLDRQGEAV